MQPFARPSASSEPAPNDVDACLDYLCPTDRRPHSYTFEPPAGVPWENCAYASSLVRIRDARRACAPPSLEREGHVLCDAPSDVVDFRDEAAVRCVLYAESSALVLALTGASEVHVFDHLVRQREAGRPRLSFGRSAVNGRAAANGRIHNDYTEASGLQRLERVLPEPARRAGVQRHAIVNLWRSIKGPVLDTPLALCDSRSIRAGELVEADVHYPARTGEIYLLTQAPQHRWCYYPAMDRHEVLVFKQYDSQLSGVARFTPHAAFDHPHTPPDAPLRESIELRCLVLYNE
jgi:hypothetical protein